MGDTARGFEAVLYHEGPELSGRTVNMGGYSTSRRQMVELARQVVPEADLTVEPGDGGESVTLPIESSSLQRVTGFGLKYSLEEGVQASIEFFRRGGATGAAAG